MTSVFVKDVVRKKSLVFTTESNSVKSLCDEMLHILNSEEFYVVCNGKIANSTDRLYHDHTYYIVPRLVGGKGGFGSMLRALGAQIEKTTNREACRDLSGRRMRDVNNEKQVKEWVEKKAEREKEKEKRREERRQKRIQFLEGNMHKFDDLQYYQQKMQVSEQLDDALQQGLNKLGSSSDENRKRQHAEESTSSAKKTCEWLGLESLSDLESSSSESSEDECAVPGPSCVEKKSHDESDKFDACSDSGVESIGQLKQEVVQSTCTVDSDSNNECTSESPVPIATLEKSVDKQQSHNHEIPKEEQIGKPGLLASLPSPSNLAKPEPVDVNLDEYESKKELENLGLDILKSALMGRGLKCGGTLEQRAERLWMVKGRSTADIDPSLFAKPSKGKGKGKKKGQ